MGRLIPKVVGHSLGSVSEQTIWAWAFLVLCFMPSYLKSCHLAFLTMRDLILKAWAQVYPFISTSLCHWILPQQQDTYPLVFLFLPVHHLSWEVILKFRQWNTWLNDEVNEWKDETMNKWTLRWTTGCSCRIDLCKIVKDWSVFFIRDFKFLQPFPFPK